jgi:hypothetical protein
LGKKRGVGLRVSESLSAIVKRVLVLLVAAMMAVVLSFGVSAPADASGYSYHGCSKKSQGYESSGEKCHHKDYKKDKKDKDKKDKKYKKDKKDKKHHYSY